MIWVLWEEYDKSRAYYNNYTGHRLFLRFHSHVKKYEVSLDGGGDGSLLLEYFSSREKALKFINRFLNLSNRSKKNE